MSPNSAELNLPKSMRAVRCLQFAGIDDSGRPLEKPRPLREVLRLEELETPTCEPGQVLVQNHFAGVQYPDALQAQGLYQERPSLPYTPGVDCCGVVLQVGEGVEHVSAGERVIGQTRIGAMAEVVSLPQDSVWPVPDGVELKCCANLSRNYFAAYHSLKVVGRLRAGDLVLVDGASGGVGIATIQLAKAMGASVIGATSTSEKLDIVQQAGADAALAYGRQSATYREFKKQVQEVAQQMGKPAGVDLIVDVVQGELFEAALLSCLRPLGTVALVGFTAGQKPIRPGMILIKQAMVAGSLWANWARENPTEQRRNVEEILQFLARGSVKPMVGNCFEIENFLAAFELYESNQGRANTVLSFR